MSRHALARAGRERLRDFARPPARSQARHLFAAAFDFDGTLAPIVADPALARLRPSTRALLERLCGLCPCLIVTGRARRDVLGRLDGLSLAGVIGSHGAEDESGVDAAARRARALVRAWRVELAATLDGASGTYVEDKDYSLSVHYRAAPDRRRARRAVIAALSRLRGGRIVPGKCVVNLVPTGSPNKGQALERALRRMGVARALYVGDDHTDEDVFASAPRRRILTVRVGPRRASRAELHLSDQGEVDELLGLVLAELESDAENGSRRRAE